MNLVSTNFATKMFHNINAPTIPKNLVVWHSAFTFLHFTSDWLVILFCNG